MSDADPRPQPQARATSATTEVTVQLLTIKQAARRLGVCTGTVYALCRNCRLRHERHGIGRGCIRIPEDAIEEYRRTVTVDANILPTPRTVKLKHLRA